MEKIDLIIQTLNKLYRSELGTKPKEDLRFFLNQTVTSVQDKNKEAIASLNRTADILHQDLKSEQSDHRTTISALSASEAELKRVKEDCASLVADNLRLESEVAEIDLKLSQETETVEKLKDILAGAFREAL